jgi:hypothetical protein
MIDPVVVVGALVVFGVGYFLTNMALFQFVKSRRDRRDSLSKKKIEWISSAGGAVCVGLMLLVVYVIPNPWKMVLFAVLVVAALGFGLYLWGKK